MIIKTYIKQFVNSHEVLFPPPLLILNIVVTHYK